MNTLSQYMSNKNISLTMVGDILAHVEVYKDAKNSYGYNFKRMFSKIKPTIQSADLAFCNQESILGGEELGLWGGKYRKVGKVSNPTFCSPYELGDAVIDCGFNLISLANNHVLDKGEEAVINSLRYWNSKPNIITSGSYISFESRDNIKINKCNGIKYAFLSYTTRTNTIDQPKGKEYLVNVFSKELAKKHIESIKDKVDLIIVSMHWGTEYNLGAIDDEQKEISRFLSDLGVHLIIGHHPHVIEPIERINDTLVIYSLGNCIACQDGDVEMKRIGAMVNVNISLKDNKINISDPNVELIYCDYNKKHRNFQLLPFSIIGEDDLKNHKTIYNEYLKKIKYIK
jgi:poly-gamma-glutamate synthesis protein (capsule biosynthesis protein)